MSDREPSAADQINRALYIAPSLINDSTSSPLLDQAIDNVAEQSIDNMEADEAKRKARQGPPEKRTVDGITFAIGPDEKDELKP
jgi:hypothetical protein